MPNRTGEPNLGVYVLDFIEDGQCEKSQKQGACIKFQVADQPACVMLLKEFLQQIAFLKRQSMKTHGNNQAAFPFEIETGKTA